VVVIGVDGVVCQNCALANHVLDSRSALNVQLILATPVSFLEISFLELPLAFAFFPLVAAF